MKKFRDLKFYVVVVLVVLSAILLLFNKAVVTGLIVLGTGVILVSFWELFLKEKENKIDQLSREIQLMKEENQNLKQTVDELSNRRLNITEVNEILDLGLIEVDTSFKRTVNKALKEGDRNVQFIGVLRVDFTAKYGIDFRKLKYRIDEERHEISIANANPQFLSFSKRNCIWEIAEILQYNEPFFGANHWKTNPKLDKLANQIKEEIRAGTERETENGPEELDWVIRPLRKHVETALELILGTRGYRIRLTELDSSDYKPLNEYSRDMAAGALP